MGAQWLSLYSYGDIDGYPSTPNGYSSTSTSCSHPFAYSRASGHGSSNDPHGQARQQYFG